MLNYLHNDDLNDCNKPNLHIYVYAVLKTRMIMTNFNKLKYYKYFCQD